MATFNERVMELVESELLKDPMASVDDLFQKAKSAVPAIGRLTKRQFHAKYPLQVKRRKKAGATGAAATKATAKPKARRKSAKKKEPAKAKAVAKAKPAKAKAKPARAAKAKAAPKARSAKAPRAPRRAPRVAAAPAAKPSADRDAIRETFLKFATDMAAAQERQDLVKLLSRVDKYVDAVVKSAGAM